MEDIIGYIKFVIKNISTEPNGTTMQFCFHLLSGSSSSFFTSSGRFATLKKKWKQATRDFTTNIKQMLKLKCASYEQHKDETNRRTYFGARRSNVFLSTGKPGTCKKTATKFSSGTRNFLCRPGTQRASVFNASHSRQQWR